MKAYGGVRLQIHTFLTSALAGGKWSVSRPCRFAPGGRSPGSHWIGGWVRPRASLDDLNKRKFLSLPGLKLRPLGKPVRSQSLCRLSYPGCLGRRKSKPKCYLNNRLGLKLLMTLCQTFLYCIEYQWKMKMKDECIRISKALTITLWEGSVPVLTGNPRKLFITVNAN
jgi:hypothetical protein